MKSLYYQFVNYIQTMSPLWFTTIWLLLFAFTFVLVMKFFKVYDGTQKNFEKLGCLIGAILLFALIIFLTYIRK